MRKSDKIKRLISKIKLAKNTKNPDDIYIYINIKNKYTDSLNLRKDNLMESDKQRW